MIHAVFLSYYPNYVKQGLEEFNNILADLNINSSLTVVSNNQDNIGCSIGQKIIAGNNTNWEFSGWDSGLAALPKINPNDYFILCNDTFNQHRVWTKNDRSRFVRAFSKLLEKGCTGMVGEINQLKSKQSFSILGRPVDRWVSTYLFGFSADIVCENNYRLSLEEEVLDGLIMEDQSGWISFGDGVSSNLQEHISQWMWPDGGPLRWYKAKNASSDLRIRKIKTILNEKYLSAQCFHKGGIFLNSAPTRPQKALVRLSSLINGGRAR